VQRLTEFLGDDPAGIAEMLDIFRDSLLRWRERLRLDIRMADRGCGNWRTSSRAVPPMSVPMPWPRWPVNCMPPR
jgi:hypothetical protein